MDIQKKLDTTLNLLHNLGNSVSELAGEYPELFAHDLIKESLSDFQLAYEEAKSRLQNPVLSISTIGTTSSGKSTIVNALMGRRIAPIESAEMSGGVLTLKHSDQSMLIIEETPDAIWETGEWKDLDDEQIYSKIKSVMHLYHTERRKKALIAPQIQVYSSLYPANDVEISGLPDSLDLEFLDLPGLKSIQDKDNLAILKPLVGKSFSLVALDYGQIDEEHRQKLLQELKKVVEYLQGRTDSMIFILNRVDLRGSDDLPLEERIQKLKEEIQSTLNLSTEPDVIPFNAQLLYYTQCAWGNSSLKENSDISPDTRMELLTKFFKDCAKPIEYHTEDDDDLNDWFRDIRKQVKKGEIIDDFKLRRILFYTRKWSGGEALWNCIKERLQDSFSELVILPTLIRVFFSFEVLENTINSIVQAQLISQKEEIEEKIKELKECQENIQSEAKKTQDSLDFFLKDLMKKFDENRRKGSDVVKELGNFLDENHPLELRKSRFDMSDVFRIQGSHTFSRVSNIFFNIKKEIDLQIIDVIQTALENNQGVFELEDELKEVLPEYLANSLARAYDKLRPQLEGFESNEDNSFLVKRISSDDDDEIAREIKRPEKYVRFLYLNVKECIEHRAQFLLETQIQNMEEILSNSTEKISNIFHEILEQEAVLFDINKAISADIFRKQSIKPPKLPKDLFSFSNNIRVQENTQNEYIGQQGTGKTERSCLIFGEEREIMEDLYADITYQELQIPSFETMGQQWREGIVNKEMEIWSTITDWFITYIRSVYLEFKRSSELFIKSINSTLESQRELIEVNSEIELKKLQEIQLSIQSTHEIFEDLKNSSTDYVSSN